MICDGLLQRLSLRGAILAWCGVALPTVSKVIQLGREPRSVFKLPLLDLLA